MKPSDLEEIRHAMNRLRAKASEGPMILTRTVMNETAIVMDAIYRAERTAAPASAAEPVGYIWKFKDAPWRLEEPFFKFASVAQPDNQSFDHIPVFANVTIDT